MLDAGTIHTIHTWIIYFAGYQREKQDNTS
jgi:hypothetical protein